MQIERAFYFIDLLVRKEYRAKQRAWRQARVAAMLEEDKDAERLTKAVRWRACVAAKSEEERKFLKAKQCRPVATLTEEEQEFMRARTAAIGVLNDSQWSP